MLFSLILLFLILDKVLFILLSHNRNVYISHVRTKYRHPKLISFALITQFCNIHFFKVYKIYILYFIFSNNSFLNLQMFVLNSHKSIVHAFRKHQIKIVCKYVYTFLLNYVINLPFS